VTADDVDVSVSSDLESSEEFLAQEIIRPKANDKIVGKKKYFSFFITDQMYSIIEKKCHMS
jgi:hypothetical protein